MGSRDQRKGRVNEFEGDEKKVEDEEKGNGLGQVLETDGIGMEDVVEDGV